MTAVFLLFTHGWFSWFCSVSTLDQLLQPAMVRYVIINHVTFRDVVNMTSSWQVAATVVEC